MTTNSHGPLRIALVNNLYPPYIVGGNEILARDVIHALRERGHEVHILTGRGKDLPFDGYTHRALDIDLDRKSELFLGGTPLTARRVVNWHLYNHLAYIGVRDSLADIVPDLTICWNLGMASAAPLAAARTQSAPVIAHPADKWLLYSLSDLGALVPANTGPQRAYLAALKYGIQPILRKRARPDYVLCVSEFIRKLHLRAGYPAAQTAPTWLGIETATFNATTHFHPGADRPWRLVYAGQLWAGKGPQVAVEAMQILAARPNLPPLSLDIYGNGAASFKTWLQEQIVQRGVADSVTLRGYASTADLVDAFHAADGYLFCSTWDEPFSGGLLEALATGLPTIATTAGGTPEAITSGHNGLLVEPGNPVALANAIERLVRAPALYERIGAQAAADIRHKWRFNQYIDRLEHYYRAIVEGHRRGTPIDLRPHTAALAREQWQPVETLASPSLHETNARS